MIPCWPGLLLFWIHNMWTSKSAAVTLLLIATCPPSKNPLLGHTLQVYEVTATIIISKVFVADVTPSINQERGNITFLDYNVQNPPVSKASATGFSRLLSCCSIVLPLPLFFYWHDSVVIIMHCSGQGQALCAYTLPQTLLECFSRPLCMFVTGQCFPLCPCKRNPGGCHGWLRRCQSHISSTLGHVPSCAPSMHLATCQLPAITSSTFSSSLCVCA